MNKYIKLGLGILALIALIVGSSLLYNNLSKNYGISNLKPMGEQTLTNNDTSVVETTDSEATVETKPEDPTPEPVPEATEEPTPEPAPEVTEEPTPEPTPEATAEPTPEPAPEVTEEPTPEPEQNTTVENPAPDFTVYTAAGEEVKLSQFLGKPVILNFWASWCGPCKREMPLFQQMYNEYGGEIAFLVVNLTDGYSETVQTASAYIEGEGYTFPVYYDTSYSAAYAYGVTSIPTTYFIDANGGIAGYAQGSLSEDVFKQGLALLGY